MVNPGKRMNILQALLSLRHGPGAAILPPEITRIHMDFAMRWNDGHFGPRYDILVIQSSGRALPYAIFRYDLRDSVIQIGLNAKLDARCRKFWRECLPRLKFHNPAIPMLVNRSTNNEGPATLSIYFRQSDTDTPRTPSEILRTMLPLARQPHSSTENEHPAPPPEEGEHVVTLDMKNVHSDMILSEFLAKTGAVLVTPTPEEQSEMRQVKDRDERGNYDRAIMKKYIDDKRHEERMMAIARQEADAIKAANT
ncbi:CI-B8 domain-containing protein [Xylariaceae sp. FL1019]|nr:CI-B8 domain-containing protein [Xylariaceae sp. FL1019]